MQRMNLLSARLQRVSGVRARACTAVSAARTPRALVRLCFASRRASGICAVLTASCWPTSKWLLRGVVVYMRVWPSSFSRCLCRHTHAHGQCTSQQCRLSTPHTKRPRIHTGTLLRPTRGRHMIMGTPTRRTNRPIRGRRMKARTGRMTARRTQVRRTNMRTPARPLLPTSRWLILGMCSRVPVRRLAAAAPRVRTRKRAPMRSGARRARRVLAVGVT